MRSRFVAASACLVYKIKIRLLKLIQGEKLTSHETAYYVSQIQQPC